jgi:NAD(P)H-hydrate repair Nnr-like enzyme with NAD(P)H-hydrate dehydratase domain
MGEVQPLAELDWPILRAASVCVDAVFGTGLSRPVPPAVWGSLVMAQESGARLVAVDILSGICADSGRILSDSGYTDFPAALTVTFERAKTGHVLADGAVLSGRLQVVPIGLDRQMNALLSGPQADRVVDATLPSLSLLEKAQGHKYSHGHALILSGPNGRGGAARLAARGALRIGAGLVTLGCPPDAIPENAARLDAVMLRGVAGGLALEEVLADPRINALCLGPGLGVDARGREVVAVALGIPVPGLTRDLSMGGGQGGQGGPGSGPGRGKSNYTLVLDADALTILSQDPDLFAALHERCILTPHAGEFARLFPDIAAKLAAPATSGPAYSKLDATRDAAARAGCTVLFKGPDTVIANPSGRAAINAAHDDRAAPWLATAGSGDVLAGFITGLLARGFPLFDAAATGAWLHVECARSFGPGLIAEDLPEELPKVFRALGL